MLTYSQEDKQVQKEKARRAGEPSPQG